MPIKDWVPALYPHFWQEYVLIGLTFALGWIAGWVSNSFLK